MTKLRFALFGAGFWSQYQLAGWYETGEAECVAIYNRTLPKAQALADRFGIARVYDDPEALIEQEQLDFIDICTSVETHAPFTQLAAKHKLPVVCQKPMATSLQEAEQMVKLCEDAGVPLLINENWRWQYPLRQLKAQLDTGTIGKVFRARIHYANSFPVFENQPFLKDLEQFILTDIGSHILDVARFLFGDAKSLYATTCRVHPDIKGEDVATTLMVMGDDVTVTCEMSYASRTEIERFPETYVYIEGNKGFLELGPDFWIRETTQAGTCAKRHVPPHYDWADPAYDLIHGSIVPCQANLLAYLQGKAQAETTGHDNLKTMQLVFGSYASAASGEVISFPYRG
ncbi:MAG: putative dehydrogenase [Chloroflexi bacterium AL-N5]|nr:putative dehydrogenase [Chloroflexi bacterium AL-N5]